MGDVTPREAAELEEEDDTTPSVDEWQQKLVDLVADMQHDWMLLNQFLNVTAQYYNWCSSYEQRLERYNQEFAALRLTGRWAASSNPCDGTNHTEQRRAGRRVAHDYYALPDNLLRDTRIVVSDGYRYDPTCGCARCRNGTPVQELRAELRYDAPLMRYSPWQRARD